MSKAGSEKKWYAVYVASRQEKKVLELLQEKGIIVFVPLIKTLRQWSDRKKMVELPLLKGYAFVCSKISEHLEILHTRGVVCFVKSNGKLAVIRDEEIERLKQVTQLGYHMEAHPITKDLKPGQKVKVGAGVFKGQEAFISENPGGNLMTLFFDSIGHCIQIRLPKDILIPVE
jgi:transcription antitermination factor NusG